MKKLQIVLLMSLMTTIGVRTYGNIIVADSLTRLPLPSASVFDSKGRAVAMTDNAGVIPTFSPEAFPVTVRYLGFQEKVIHSASADTVFLSSVPTHLGEVIVESRSHKLLHILAYVREYSTLSSYTDTVFLFREKMVDYMLNPDKARFNGWRSPRIIKSRSYYRFTDAYGLDSVSNRCSHHFSWSDWVGIPHSPSLPQRVRESGISTDTIFGRYSPAEIWMRNDDRMIVDVDVLADTASRRWVPNLSTFFRKNLDFEKFRTRFRYANVTEDSIRTTGLAGYSFNIESNGRGHDIFRFSRHDIPCYVSTFGEVYILDKEYITVKEAKIWDKRDFSDKSIELIESPDAPDLQQPILDLIARVDAIDHNRTRLDFTPDQRLVAKHRHKENFAGRAFNLLKNLTGISAYKHRKNLNDQWDTFRRSRQN